MRRFAVAVTVALSLASASAQANFVTNGGFETGDFTGWTQTGNTTFNGVQCPGPSSVVFAGNCSAFFGPVGSVGGITQSVATAANTAYALSYAFDPDGGSPSSFLVQWNGATVEQLLNPPNAPFGLRTILVTSNGTGINTLAFSFRDDPGFFNLDAVDVSNIPEPTTMVLLGAGLFGLAAARRRKAA